MASIPMSNSVTGTLFFWKKKMKKSRDCTIAQPVHIAMNISARSGAEPSVPSQASVGEATREHANALLQEMAITRDLRRQARNADRLNTKEASCARAPGCCEHSSVDMGCVGPRLPLGCHRGSQGGVHRHWRCHDALVGPKRELQWTFRL